MVSPEIYVGCWCDYGGSGKSFFTWIWTTRICKDHRNAVPGFLDFLTNSVMMPIAAFATCLLISRVIGVKKIEEEVLLEGGTFKRKKIFNFMIKYLCPIFAVIILFSSVANAFGWISM